LNFTQKPQFFGSMAHAADTLVERSTLTPTRVRNADAALAAMSARPREQA
jgi:hypothetical protein